MFLGVSRKPVHYYAEEAFENLENGTLYKTGGREHNLFIILH